MAENKKSFILYCDQKGLWDKLSNEQAGVLIKHVIAYVNDENPTAPDFITELAFEPIKAALKRDLIRWEETREKRVIAGQASAEARRNKSEQVSTSVESVEHNPTNPTVSVNGTVSVSGNGTVIKEDTKVLPNSNDPSFNEKLSKAVNTIVPYLNLKAGTAFKTNNKATERLISARLKDGHTWIEFKTVIDSKVAEWKENKEMKGYLRPSTLFGTKFEAYVQAANPVADVVKVESMKINLQTYNR